MSLKCHTYIVFLVDGKAEVQTFCIAGIVNQSIVLAKRQPVSE